LPFSGSGLVVLGKLENTPVAGEIQERQLLLKKVGRNFWG